MSIWTFVWIVLPLAVILLGCISLLLLLFANLRHDRQMEHVAICLLFWASVSLVLPFVARKWGVFRSWILGILLVLLSPAAFFTYYAVASSCVDISAFPKKDLQFTDRESIVSLTGLADFPEFEYLSNDYDGWMGWHTVKFKFKEEASDDFYMRLDSLRTERDNVFWALTAIEGTEDKAFYGADSIFIYRRGWDGQYISASTANMPSAATVELYIGKRGFRCAYLEGYNMSIERFAKRDSLSALTGVAFPAYKNVDCQFRDCGIDYSIAWTMLLDEVPDAAFIEQIKLSPSWQQRNDGSYKYETPFSPDRQYSEEVIVEEGSRKVKAIYNTN